MICTYLVVVRAFQRGANASVCHAFFCHATGLLCTQCTCVLLYLCFTSQPQCRCVGKLQLLIFDRKSTSSVTNSDCQHIQFFSMQIFVDVHVCCMFTMYVCGLGIAQCAGVMWRTAGLNECLCSACMHVQSSNHYRSSFFSSRPSPVYQPPLLYPPAPQQLS